MPLQLRCDVHWCNSGGRVVFLDVEADRYFCLPAAANEAFLRLAAGRSQHGDPERLRMLTSRGILVEDGTSATIRQPPLIELPVRDFADERTSSSDLFAMIRQLVSEMAAVRLLRTASFSKAVEAIERKELRDQRAPRDRDNVLQAIAGAARTASYVMRMHNRCLVRAFAVHSICARRGIRPKLVFGVIAHPFAAHCWVQLGNAVLVGGFEQARLYTPILVVE
jgi:transglutaminase superfamily protein